MSQKRHISSGLVLLAMFLLISFLGCERVSFIGDSELLFSRFYGGADQEDARGFVKDENGNYLLAGSSQSFSNGGWDVFVVKTDPDGNEMWRRNYGGLGNEKTGAVLNLPGGHFLLIGEMEDIEGQRDICLLRFNENGDSIWNYFYGDTLLDERGVSIFPTIDGGYALLGSQSRVENSPDDIWLVKIGGNGVEEWNNSYGFTGQETGVDLYQDTEGNFIMLATSDRTGKNKMLLAKADSEGNELWYLNFGPEGNVEASGMDWNGNRTYLSGTFQTANSTRAVLIALDSNYDTLWTYLGPEGTLANDVALSPEGNAVICGSAEGPVEGNTMLYLEIISPDGTPLLDEPFTFGGDNSAERANSLFINADGTISICGTTFFDDNPMIWLLKADLIPD